MDKVIKKIGIWMDHSNANLMELTTAPIQTKTIASEFTHEEKEVTLEKGEKSMHHKEQHLQAAYYKKLSTLILGYDEVLIFGPTTAKDELLNTMKANHLFEKIKIEVKQADKMTENQQHAFVQNYFSKH